MQVTPTIDEGEGEEGELALTRPQERQLITHLKNMAVHTERKRGRPPKDEKLSAVSVYLPPSLHDAISREATIRGKSVASLVREVLSRSDFRTLQK